MTELIARDPKLAVDQLFALFMHEPEAHSTNLADQKLRAAQQMDEFAAG